ncbi:hypothetical protein FIBSPDRAFT_886940 [Athelia psychrophila]|uniref:Uncharacterized protein n=1 Tax=Athelia psychrophila TaxID=1759441 RepID=A0A166Q3R6_9AGAM|nr:hypothetical protein FIBSPDRAFT_886940 [Fibularhizoctonia sp. CBS 109695]
MALLKDITDALIHYPDLYSSVPFLQIDRFYVHEFLRDALSWTDLETMQCWSALKAIVWSDEHGPNEELTPDDIALFQLYGNPANARKQEQLAAIMFYPPTLHCLNCNGRLTELRRYPVVFHSAAHGPSPALTSSLGCTRKLKMSLSSLKDA